MKLTPREEFVVHFPRIQQNKGDARIEHQLPRRYRESEPVMDQEWEMGRCSNGKVGEAEEMSAWARRESGGWWWGVLRRRGPERQHMIGARVHKGDMMERTRHDSLLPWEKVCCGADHSVVWRNKDSDIWLIVHLSSSCAHQIFVCCSCIILL